jgi:divalent metal cation (Fe/Co/Zn/Cd) transporter
MFHLSLRAVADNVEMEIVLPGTMTVMESHDIALALQHKIESLEDVERAFVHVSQVFSFVQPYHSN